ncbi:hypothetical protein RhiirC2_775190 [Rhizophagus irregularis]|uniref:Uncharacterized protein n=1 Tax=Rhizophagus irregularis TaxID=588596 RepID=A0A2N1NJL5_9GLOM|nr:hypothetical protein RhiirC2_775190 [Rhizophagus irregularis]
MYLKIPSVAFLGFGTLGDGDEEDVGINTLIELANKPLKCDNIAPDEVVKVIKDYRAKNKIVYAPYQASDNSTEGAGKVRKKLEELEEIFMQTSNDMEWEHINREALRMIKRIISMAEQREIMREYTTLNDDFKKRLKDKNRKTDEREKRTIIETPPPWKPKESEENNKKKRQG